MDMENPPGLEPRLATWAAQHKEGALWTLVVGGFFLVIAYRKDPVMMAVGWAAILIGALILILPLALRGDRRARRHAALFAAVISAAAAIVGFFLVENIYFAPSCGLITLLLFLCYFLSSERLLLAYRADFGPGVKHRWFSMTLIVGILVAGLVMGWWTSVEKLAKLRVTPPSRSSTPPILPTSPSKAEARQGMYPSVPPAVPHRSQVPASPQPKQMAAGGRTSEAPKEPQRLSLRSRAQQEAEPPQNPKPKAPAALVARPLEAPNVTRETERLPVAKSETASITLRTLFEETDFADFFRARGEATIENDDGTKTAIEVQVYRDFSSKAMFLGLFIPHCDTTHQADPTDAPCAKKTNAICKSFADHYSEAFKLTGNASRGGFIGEPMTSAKDLTFTGRIYIYHEDELEPEQIVALRALYLAKNVEVQFRGSTYWYIKLLQAEKNKAAHRKQ